MGREPMLRASKSAMKKCFKKNISKQTSKKMRLSQHNQDSSGDKQDISYFTESEPENSSTSSSPTKNQDDLKEWFTDPLSLKTGTVFGRTSKEKRLLVIEKNQKTILETLRSIQAQIMDVHDTETRQTAKLQATIKQITNNKQPVKLKIKFPIESEEGLQQLERSISRYRAQYVNLMKSIVRPEGLHMNLEKLFTRPLILELNYSGVQGKKPFSDYVKINKALYDAIRYEGYTYDDYVRSLRNAFKKVKDRHYKDVYEAKNKMLELAAIEIKEEEPRKKAAKR